MRKISIGGTHRNHNNKNKQLQRQPAQCVQQTKCKRVEMKWRGNERKKKKRIRALSFTWKFPHAPNNNWIYMKTFTSKVYYKICSRCDDIKINHANLPRKRAANCLCLVWLLFSHSRSYRHFFSSLWCSVCKLFYFYFILFGGVCFFLFLFADFFFLFFIYLKQEKRSQVKNFSRWTN